MDTPTRLDVGVFEIPTAEIRRGYRSACYFNRAKTIAASTPKRDSMGVLMQVFQRKDSILCGIDEALAIIKTCCGHWRNEAQAQALFDNYMDMKLTIRREHDPNIRKRLLTTLVDVECELDRLWQSGTDLITVDALYDGDEVEPWEAVMHITGAYSAFAHLESVYLGVLARRTLIATNTRRVMEAAKEKQVLFFADRFDHFATQGGDGYAAHVGGAHGFATEAMGAWWGEPAMGTMPHALIAFFGGDTLTASRVYHQQYPDTNLIALVDFHNDCVRTSLEHLEAFGDELWGVRLDTSGNLMDRSMFEVQDGQSNPLGVNPDLVTNVRKALDAHGGQHVKIIVSGGFTADKIAAFEAIGVATDGYAVGSSLLRGENDFTADIVRPVAKVGRRLKNAERLVRVW